MKKTTKAEERVLDSFSLNPHPDGQPWTKCCTGNHENESETQCQCFMKKPRRSKSRFDFIVERVSPGVQQLVEEGGRFFCVHRKDGEYHRECAGWFARIRSKFIGPIKPIE